MFVNILYCMIEYFNLSSSTVILFGIEVSYSYVTFRTSSMFMGRYKLKLECKLKSQRMLNNVTLLSLWPKKGQTVTWLALHLLSISINGFYHKRFLFNSFLCWHVLGSIHHWLNLRSCPWMSPNASSTDVDFITAHFTFQEALSALPSFVIPDNNWVTGRLSYNS